ncbi:MAG: galactose mutarotase [Candidatus Symbiothrix sp.]|nr:galactose mutarotase [Candidatus Symbiothrix sp.]
MNTTLAGLRTENFETTIGGKPVKLFVLTNKKGAEVTATNFGGKIVSICVPSKLGKLVDVVLGKSNIQDYTNDQEPYFGALCGRVANRIANGRFTLEGKDYVLAVNNGPNHLHGGIVGFNSVVWDAKQTNSQTLELTYTSQDGEEGYPGTLQIKVVYYLTDNNALEISYQAVTDKTTLINLTNHSYFNLAGEGDPYIGDQLLQIFADKYLPTNDVAIPFGDPAPVEGTPFDFRRLHPVGKYIDQPDQQLIYGNGYDHTFVLNKEGKDLTLAAKAISLKTGIVMEVLTTEPGVQLYTANYCDGSFVGKNGHTYPKRSAFCLETQHFPDSIHNKDYPSTVLHANEIYSSKTVFRFSIDNYLYD